MLSRLATVLQDLSAEEDPDGDQQEGLVPHSPLGTSDAQVEAELPEDAMERLTHLEQLVVQLKELVREKDTLLVQKDTELSSKDARLKSEKEEADARFTKLKLQAKAKMASLNKQINELKGQSEATQSPNSSFTGGSSTADEEQLQSLRDKLKEEEANSRRLEEQLHAAELQLQEKEALHSQQLQVLQAVVCEKDVRFQEQIQRHEEELLRVTNQTANESETLQALQAAAHRCSELEEALNSRSQELEMLQQEVSSADQQKQILTAQFRQMEQELTETLRLREEDRLQWTERVGSAEAELEALRAASELQGSKLKLQASELELQRSELGSLREAERASREALERKAESIAELEQNLTRAKAAEIAAVQALEDASERSQVEITRLESELISTKEAESTAANAQQDASEEEKSKMEELEKELGELREERDIIQRKSKIFEDIWRHLRPLVMEGYPEEIPVPADPSKLVDTVRSVEMELNRLREECSAKNQECAQLTLTVDIVREQLDRKSAEQEEAAARIQELQLSVATDKSDGPGSPENLPETETAHVQALKEQLLEKDTELAALRESLLLALKQTSDETVHKENESLIQNQGVDAGPPDDSAALPDFMEDSQIEEETTLIAEDSSVLSLPATNESSPELIGHQSDSPGESKGASSDEMIASSDSEVAHSSWTLLEAMNQDGAQEEDLAQSWVATTEDQDAPAVKAEVAVSGEVEQGDVPPQGSTSQESSMLFAQALAEELQRRYGELLAELETLRVAVAKSQERIQSLEEETHSLSAEKDEAQAQVKELESLRENVEKQLLTYSTEKELLEEQLQIQSSENQSKEEGLQSLQAEVEMGQRALSMLSAQLEDRELLTSKLEKKIQEMESGMSDISRTSHLSTESLLQKDLQIHDLYQRLSEKEKEAVELSESLTAKLLQAEEEKVQACAEVDKLKERIVELGVKEEKQDVSHEEDQSDDQLVSLRKERVELETQLTSMKKKLQAALVQRKELLKRVADLEKEEKLKEKDETESPESPETVSQKEESDKSELQRLEFRVSELEEALRCKGEEVQVLQQKITHQDQVLAEALAQGEEPSAVQERFQSGEDLPETTALQSQVASLEAECETLQKKVQDAQESRKETIRKAKEKDRHHREQLKQQKEEYGELVQRLEEESGQREALLCRVRELEDELSCEKQQPHPEPQPETTQDTRQQQAQGWGQEEWVDFAAPEAESSKPETVHSQEQTAVVPVQVEEDLSNVREEIQSLRINSSRLEEQLQDTHAKLLQKEAEALELSKELQELRDKEQQIQQLSLEIQDLREKYQQAEAYAETLKTEVEATARKDAEFSILTLQTDVQQLKQFLNDKKQEIMDLGQQLSEQNSLILSMQGVVSQKDELISSLQEELKVQQEKAQKLEAESLQKGEEEDAETKLQQLQRKFQAALISRKEVLKENKAQKEQLLSSERTAEELRERLGSAEGELEKLRAERGRLIEEVDRALLENQSLGSTCESLKLAMEGLVGEKEARRSEAEMAREEAARVSREWQEKVEGMKEEYETLLKSYENVSDEAERVRRVLEAARQERQELTAKARAQEAARQEAQRQAEEARAEVDTVKDKMRKFAKTKQQKILELEEENERLREMQEKPDKGQGALQTEAEAMKAQLQAAEAERDSLEQQVKEMRDQLADAEKRIKVLESEAVVEEAVAVEKAHTLMIAAEPVQSSEEEKEQPEADPKANSTPNEQGEVETLKLQLIEMEVKVTTMEAECVRWREQEAELQAELSSLRSELQESQDRASSAESSVRECLVREKLLLQEATEREEHLKQFTCSLEAEKDNLEERLMNQLAQLNGSVADYQQEAAEQRQSLERLQLELEEARKERDQREEEAQSERDRTCRLEEERRLAQRQKEEDEAGKQRELELQLRSAQRVKEGSQSRARQLEELLREKQLEVRQLQKDCVRYQERLSQAAREAKALQLDQQELLRKLERAQLEERDTAEELRKTQHLLDDCKVQLAKAQEEARGAVEAKVALERGLEQKEAKLRAEAEETLDTVRFRLGAELKETELRLEEADAEREREEDAAREAREEARAAERRTQEIQTRLDQSLARLAAFSRSMSSLQDDRDRVLDEAKQWESRFNSALQSKEAEVRDAEARVRELSEQLQKTVALKEELQETVSRLQKADKDWRLRLEVEEGKVSGHQSALREQKEELEEIVAKLQATLDEVLALKKETESLSQRNRALDEALSKVQVEQELTRTELQEREAQERRLCINLEQLEADLRSSKALTEDLQMELQQKEEKLLQVLGEKEQAVTQAAEEARREGESRVQEAEEELQRRRGEVRDLDERVRKAEEESVSRKARLDSFVKAMGSLQDDRDRVLGAYKQLEEKHLKVMLDKDGLIQEAASENNSLKEELRSLRAQRDDLYAEKGKLGAQLHGYREELSQVLTMKDSQHKQLLAAQKERIIYLERERQELEDQLGRAGQPEVQQSPTLDAPGAEVEKLQEQLQAARAHAEALEEQLLKERQEHESGSRELAELRWEGGVMRSESESAQERVAELARDLLTVEQRLLEEAETTKQLRAEKEAFTKAMASLQDSREQALNKVQELSLKVEEMSRSGGQAAGSPGGAAGEVWGLKNALQALQNDRERLLEQLDVQEGELKKQKSELSRLGAGELIKVGQELFEEKKKSEQMLEVITQLEEVTESSRLEVQTLRLERDDLLTQAEQLKQQTLTTLSEKDRQLRQLTTMLDDAHAQMPRLQEERYQRQEAVEVDSAPGAPQERSSLLDSKHHLAEVKELQRRLEEETQQRIAVEEQLMATQERLKRHSQASWLSAQEGDLSETAVFIEPPGGAVTRTRRGGPGLRRMFRVAFCSRHRTPLLLGIYLLTVHVVLFLCLGGFL